MADVNFVAVLVAAVSAFLLGGLWYSPALFATRWAESTGQTTDRLQSGSTILIFGGAFLLSLVAAFVFAMFLGPDPDLAFALSAGFFAGLFWVAAALGIIYLFERRPLRLWLINGGYLTLQFTLYGAVLGAM